MSKYKLVMDGGLPRDMIYIVQADPYDLAVVRFNPGYELTAERERDLRVVARAANWVSNRGEWFSSTTYARQ